MPPTGPVGRTRGAPPKLTVGTTATERKPPMKGSMAPMVPALRKFLVFVSLRGFFSWCARANGGSGSGEYRALTRTRVRGKDRNTSLPGRSPPDPRRETRTRAPGAARTHLRVESYLFWEVAQGPTRWVRGGVDVRSRRGEGRRRGKAAEEGGGGRRGSENFCRARACASDVCDAATNQRRLRLHVQGRRRNTVKKAEPPDARENEKIFKRSNRSRTVRETDFQPRMVVPKIGESR